MPGMPAERRLSATGAAQADQIAQLTGRLSARQDRLQAGLPGRHPGRPASQLVVFRTTGQCRKPLEPKAKTTARGIER